MISILCPTRGRPDQFTEMADSAVHMACRPDRVEIVARLDLDDFTRHDYPRTVQQIIGARATHSDLWNECANYAKGDILMLCGDDIRFRTAGWDLIVEHEFRRWPDRIVLLHGDDGGGHDQTVGTHPFLHRRWVDTVGYFTPPGFVSDFTDAWLDELATAVGRKVRVPVVTEHLHPLWGKGEIDRTHEERLDRHAEHRHDIAYAERESERLQAVDKLRAAIQVP